MNTHDVSDIPQYFEFLRRQRQSLQEAQSRKGQRPQERRSREEIIMRFRFMGTAGRGSYDKFNLRSAFIPPAYPPCTSALAELKKTMIKDLLLETHHRGTYLLLRSITPPAKLNAVMTIVEDESQDVVMLQLYYQEGDNDSKIEDIAGEGTILIVREPYFKLMSDGEYGLRVDHLSDVTYLPAYDQRVPNHWQKDIIVGSASVDDWKIKGNDFYKGSKYRAAIECYTKALDCSPTEDKSRTIKINRALAYIKTKQFEAALFDLEYDPSPQKPNEKALFSKALALYHLQRYRECREILKTVLVNYPSNAPAKTKLTRTIQRLAEQEDGKYNLKGLRTEAAKLRPPQLDHTTFSGPVAIRTSNGRGRGLFTTRAVKAGELLLCEKAFAYAFDDSQKATAGGNSTILINAETNSITIGAQAELIQLIVQKMYRNPSSATTITNLHHGSYEPVKVTEVDGTPVVDT
ncbi:TPR domain protein [Fonsecaea pedrosoi]|nr:TPR domain protein [Fonsecaea pedrosoi]